ncbi:HD domain-containing phosphohydrolase [Pseudothermotoga thermarum]|nr:HD domain-containing phosphohydrolase [Pseudothermotoga thermarum]
MAAAMKSELAERDERIESLSKELTSAKEALYQKEKELNLANLELDARAQTIEAMNQQLLAMNEQLQAQIQELDAMNEELSRLLKELENSTEKFSNCLEKLADIAICNEEKVEEEIKATLLSVFEDADVRILNTKGIKLEFVQGMVFSQQSTTMLSINEQLALLITRKSPLLSAEIKFLNAIAKLFNIFMQIREYFKERESLSEKVINVLISSLSLYEPHTADHAKRLAKLSKEVALKLGLDQRRAELVSWAALVHDIGKLAVDKEILNKPSRLDPEEYEKVKTHPVIGAQLLKAGGLDEIAKIVMYHHERYDGKGYPEGLKADQIPIESRIICVIDAFDAMISDRPYRKAMTIEQAKEELLKNSGTQFDPKVVKIFLEAIEEMNKETEG